MKNACSLLKDYLNDFNTNKKSIFAILEKIDDTIMENFPFPENFKSVNIFRETPIERLNKINKVLKDSEKNEMLLLPHMCHKAHDILRTFVSENCLGFIKNFYLSENGMFVVEITGMISTSSYDKVNSEKQQRENYIEKLNKLELSFKMENERQPLWLDASDNNISIIKNLFENNGARGFCYEYMYSNSLEYSLLIPADKIVNFITNKEDLEPVFINGLKEVDIMNVKKNLEEMLFAIASHNTLNIQDTTSFLIHSLFAEITTILGYDSKVRKNYEERNKEEKKINTELNEKEEILKKKSSFDNTAELVKKLYEDISIKMARELCFSVKDFKVSEYGNITFSSSKIDGFCLLKRENIMPDKIFLERFHCRTKPSIGSLQEIHLLDTDMNKGVIERILTELFTSSEIVEINLSKKNDYLTIKNVKISISNIADCF